MEKFYIEYNPYKIETIFKKNGVEISGEDNNDFNAKKNRRLQRNLSSEGNWKGLPKEICDSLNNPSEIEITFKGRKIDFDDLEYSLKKYEKESNKTKNKTKFNIKFIEAVKDEDIMAGLDRIVSEIKEKNLPEFNEAVDAYKEAKNGIFEINVIGTTSSGKSTLINALLRNELLPVAITPCTAKITEIINNDDIKNFVVECLDADRKIKYEKTEADSEKLGKFNTDDTVKFIEIEGNIPGIRNNKVKLLLRDTPGPNSNYDEHKKLTEEVITDDKAIVLYVLNAAQLSIEADRNLLDEIAKIMKKQGKEARDRFIFVINKCDALDSEKENEKLENIINGVKKDLAKIGIRDPIILSTSALTTLLAYKEKRKLLTGKEKRDIKGYKEQFMKEIHLEKYATLTPTIEAKLTSKIRQYQKDGNIDNELLIHTGITVVEETIKEFIDKYAYPIKINDAVNKIKEKFIEMDMLKKIELKLCEDEEYINEFKKQINETKDKIENSKSISEKYKNEIDSFGIDDDLKSNFSNDINKDLSKIISKYKEYTWVNKVSASEIILRFKNDLSNQFKNFETKVRNKIDNEIYNKGNIMLNNYKNHIETVLNDIKIDGFDFKKTISFNENIIDDMIYLERVIRENERDHYRKEKRIEKNPKAKGIWGWLKVLLGKIDKEVVVEVNIKDGKEVNISKIIQTVINNFKISVQDNVDEVLKIANDQVNEYKCAFKNSMEKLNKKIADWVDNLDKISNCKADLEKNYNNNKVFYYWILKMGNEVNDLLSFEEE